MSVLAHIGESDKFPTGLSRRQRLEAVYRKMAFLQANKYMKDNGFITRYKGKRSVAQYCNAGYKKVAWNMVKALAQLSFTNIPTLEAIQKTRNANFVLKLDDDWGQRGGFGYTYARRGGRAGRTGHPTEAQIRIRQGRYGRMDRLMRQTNPMTATAYDLEYYGLCVVTYNFSKLNLLSMDEDSITLEEMHASMQTHAEALRTAMIERE